MKHILTVLALACLVMLTMIGCKKQTANEETPTVETVAQPQEETVEILDLANKPSGLCFGPFVEGPGPEKGAIATVEQVNVLLKKLKPYLGQGIIRTYSSAPLKDSSESIPSLAKKMGFKVYAGCWLSKDKAANDREITYLLGEIYKKNVDVAIVGSEVLLRGDLKPDELVAYVKKVKVAKVPVGVADLYNEFVDHPEVSKAADKLMINIYPYWSGVAIDGAFDSFLKCYKIVRKEFPDKEVVISETGWPTAGKTIKNAVPDGDNAAKYFDQVMNWSNYKKVTCLYFEAFDEPWKVTNEGEQGAHWGLWTKDGDLKPCMLEVMQKTPYYEEPVVVIPPPTEAQLEAAVAKRKLSITCTGGPVRDEYGPITGTVGGVKPSQYGLAMYIKVRGGWWTKPYWSDPVTYISTDGTWSCDVITGGVDGEFTEARVYLVKKGYEPPAASGGDLPYVRAKKSLRISRNTFKKAN